MKNVFFMYVKICMFVFVHVLCVGGGGLDQRACGRRRAGRRADGRAGVDRSGSGMIFEF